MIAILFSFILLFLLFLGIGILSLKLGRTSVKEFSETLITGIFSSSVIIFLLSFFFGINIYIELLLIAIGLAGIIYGKKELRYLFSFKKYYFNGSFLGLSIISLFIISFAPYILDHFGYYVPTIKVLDSAGIQTGIANIELVLGQNSLWHILESGLNESLDIYLRLNGFIVLIYLIFIFEKKHWYLLVFLPFFLMFAQSPAPDLAIYIFSVYAIDRWYFENSAPKYLLLLLSTWVLLIKISAFWLPLFIGLSLLISILNRKEKIIITPWVIVIGLTILGLFKSYLSSSNLFFPLNSGYVESAWQPDSRIIEKSAEFALQKSFDFQYSYEEIKNFSPQEKIINWLQLGGFKGFLNLLICIISVVFFYWVSKYQRKQYYLLSILLLLKLVLVFWFSAQQRFMWDVVLIMLILMIQNKAWNKLYRLLCSIGIIAVTVFFCFPSMVKRYIPSFALSEMNQGFQAMQLVKPIVYELDYWENNKVGNLEFNIPINYPFLYDVPFVALSYSDLEYYKSLNIFPQWEDGKIVMKTFPDGESNQIEDILNKKTAE